MVKVVANCRGHEHPQVLATETLVEGAQVDHTVHHLSDTKTVTEVVERIVTVILLNSKLKTKYLSAEQLTEKNEERLKDRTLIELTSHRFRMTGFMLNSSTKSSS